MAPHTFLGGAVGTFLNCYVHKDTEHPIWRNVAYTRFNADLLTLDDTHYYQNMPYQHIAFRAFNRDQQTIIWPDPSWQTGFGSSSKENMTWMATVWSLDGLNCLNAPPEIADSKVRAPEIAGSLIVFPDQTSEESPNYVSVMINPALRADEGSTPSTDYTAFAASEGIPVAYQSVCRMPSTVSLDEYMLEMYGTIHPGGLIPLSNAFMLYCALTE